MNPFILKFSHIKPICMAVEIITKEDLQHFKKELVAEIKEALKEQPSSNKKYLQSPEVRELLGISPGTLQHLRVTGQLPFTKVGGKIFYDMVDIEGMMEENKKG